MSTTRHVAILLFDDAEVLDFCGPFEVFSVTGREIEKGSFRVWTVAEEERLVVARNGLRVQPDYTLANCPPFGILLVPGGMGTRREMNRPEITDWIRERATSAELVLSVCTGALLLAKAGLLDGLEATTHFGALDLLCSVAPQTKVHKDRRFIDNGKVITSAGVAAGIDMSFHVVARLLGADTAQTTARYMEYPWSMGS
jgi:transcriptional regulator GlxA family with amidase domain